MMEGCTATIYCAESEGGSGTCVEALELAPARVDVVAVAGGGYILSSPMPLEPYEKSLGALLRGWNERAPQRTFLAERAGDGWRTMTYAQASLAANCLAQALLNRGLGPDSPLMILSGNSINHALLTLAGFLVGIPVVPVSPAYSLMSEEFGRLKSIFHEVGPGLVYVEDAALFSRALEALDISGVEVAATTGEGKAFATTRFQELLATIPTPQVEEAFASVGQDTVAKILYSSGSTGIPKGILNTHGMLCANQQMIAQVLPFAAKTPPVFVDWLPWNHTFGGNHNFNMILKHGGTLYIDAGKPVPPLMPQTLRNLKEISTTIYFNVPAGFAMLLPHLERDEDLRRTFFKDLQLIFYAAAALSQDIWERLEAVSLQAIGRKIPIVSGWGSTETAPSVTCSHFAVDRAGNLGLPMPGIRLKMVPNGEKHELRVKGPNVTPGYFRRPDLTAAAFDEEGYYRIGDAGAFVDPEVPEKGIEFKGRIAEDFKLNTGTWVHVGAVRVAVLAAASPVILDALVTGHDRACVGILAWPNIQACREICGDTEGKVSIGELLRRSEVVGHLRRTLAQYNEAHPGSSTRVARIMLMEEPPSIDANEITDKGYINQRLSLERRKHLVERLYADASGPDVIIL